MRWRRRDSALDLRIRIAQLEADVGFVVTEPELLRRSTGRLPSAEEVAARWKASASASATNYAAVAEAYRRAS